MTPTRCVARASARTCAAAGGERRRRRTLRGETARRKERPAAAREAAPARARARHGPPARRRPLPPARAAGRRHSFTRGRSSRVRTGLQRHDLNRSVAINDKPRPVVRLEVLVGRLVDPDEVRVVDREPGDEPAGEHYVPQQDGALRQGPGLLRRVADQHEPRDRQCEQQDGLDGGDDEEPVEGPVVVPPHAVAEPLAVVVEAVHAHVAHAAVHGPRRAVQVARVAVLDPEELSGDGQLDARRRVRVLALHADCVEGLVGVRLLRYDSRVGVRHHVEAPQRHRCQQGGDDGQHRANVCGVPPQRRGCEEHVGAVEHHRSESSYEPLVVRNLLHNSPDPVHGPLHGEPEPRRRVVVLLEVGVSAALQSTPALHCGSRWRAFTLPVSATPCYIVAGTFDVVSRAPPLVPLSGVSCRWATGRFAMTFGWP
ncbi:helix-turn-helix transcriptional regulator [Babesia caballi]|uniref:Helix-turn-helix transcriptional regulator n=1 Tax=Babesia caballi TaxID=5871 RepID=A0AAV4LZE6_BABCB|nr:helix-turn-helix transcriptional regulator [Babesia caballi]